MTLPTFLIVGASKAGTTALYELLDQHPEIFLSPLKEPRFLAFEREGPRFSGPGDDEFFNRPTVTSAAEYERLFEGAAGRRAIGEGSTYYLYGPESIAGIRRHVPDATFVAILRDPAARAYSSFLHARRDGREPLERFADALEAEDERIAAGWGPLFRYRDVGLYAEQVARFQAEFGPERLHVCLYEDFARDPAAVVGEICDFLGVGEFDPDLSVRTNVGGEPRSRAAQRFLDRPSGVKTLVRRVLPDPLERAAERLTASARTLNLRRPLLDSGLARELRESFRADVKSLERVLGRDLSAWLKP